MHAAAARERSVMRRLPPRFAILRRRTPPPTKLSPVWGRPWRWYAVSYHQQLRVGYPEKSSMHSGGKGGGGTTGPWAAAHALRPRSASATVQSDTARRPLTFMIDIRRDTWASQRIAIVG